MKDFEVAKECPADKIREYIESIIDSKEIPSKIILSPECIEFFFHSKLVTCIGPGDNGDEACFFWKKAAEYPALTVRTKQEDDGFYYLTYIREEASAKKPAFEWDVTKQEANDRILVIAKPTDQPDDIADLYEQGGMTL